jgi:Uma2 family endonuclease
MNPDSGTRSKLTFADWLQFPEDGQRHEILDGEHFVSPQPLLRHQLVSSRLFSQLSRQILEPGLGDVLFPPTGVRLSEHDCVQPDLLVVLAEHRSRERADVIEGPPDLVVEVLSPRNDRYDRGTKRKLYEQHGVPEYWIVDPKACMVEQLVLRDGLYVLLGEQRESISFQALPHVRVDLGKVW